MSELALLPEYLDGSLEKGWIRSSKNPVGSSVFFVPKRNGEMRLCVDYCELNKLTIKKES